MTKKVAVFVLLLMMILIRISEASDNVPVQMAEKFFLMTQKGDISEAYDELLKGSNIRTAKPQVVDLIKRQTESALPLYGDIIGFEKIREEKVGTSILRLVYVLKLEKAPIVWEFYFYKPKAVWFLGNIIFNDQFNMLSTIQ